MSVSERELIVATREGGAEADNVASSYVFAQRVRRCLITRLDGSAGSWKYRVAEDASVDAASNTVYDGVAKGGETTDISLGGTRAIKEVSIYFAGTGAAPTAGEIRVTGLV